MSRLCKNLEHCTSDMNIRTCMETFYPYRSNGPVGITQFQRAVTTLTPTALKLNCAFVLKAEEMGKGKEAKYWIAKLLLKNPSTKAFERILVTHWIEGITNDKWPWDTDEQDQ